MADFVYPQFQNPEILRSAALGQQMGMQQAMMPGEMQGQQQQLQTGQLNLDMLRQMMGFKQQAMQAYGQALGTQSTQQGQQPGAPTGGIQSGPQGAVSQDDPNDPLGNVIRRVSTANAVFGSQMALAKGDDPNKPLADAVKLQTEVRQDQLERAKLQSQPALNLLDSVFNSDSPARTVMANPGMLAHWPKVAAQLGIDPTDFNDANVRKGLAFEANNLRAQSGQPAKDYPVALQNVNLGQGEIGQLSPVTGKKEGELIARQTPGYTLKDIYDPSTNSMRAVPVQTSGFGMSGINPSAPAAGAPAGGVNLGMKAPTDPELKAAMFGSEMRSGMNTLNRLESGGFSLSPKTRTLVINAATSEDEGMLKQLLSQEALVHMSPKEQTYVAALMPMLQAAGHDQSGARLTTSQVRQNIESLLPIDVKNKEAMTQVKENRQGFYNGLLTQAGSAAQLPQYKDSLGADLAKAQGKPSSTGNHPAAIQSLLDKYSKKP